MKNHPYRLLSGCWLAIGLSLALLATAAPAGNAVYGFDLYNRLAIRYPQHFSVINTSGELIDLTQETQVGEYLLARLTTPVDIGWIQWWGREPHSRNKNAVAQCYLRKNGIGKGAELLFNKTVDEKSYPLEDFWRAVIFECCNAESGNQFNDLKESLKIGDMTREEFTERMIRLEYRSATKADAFQVEIWRPFCEENRIPYSKESWFLKGRTFEKWSESLRSSQEGLEYLDTYR
jgi:hypothetical protein